MKIRSLIVVLIASSLAVLGLPGSSSADHCSPYADPNPLATSPTVAAIASGYYGVGGVGALDGYGCPAGNHVADTRLVLPQADFVVLVLARANCTPGQQITGTLSGLGVNAASVPMRCGADLLDRKAFVSDLYPLDKTKSGTITGSVSFGGKSYGARSKTIV